MKTVVTIPKRVTQGTDLVVVRRKDYERLQRHVAEMQDALAKIRRGELEYRTGKTRLTQSLAEIRR